MEKNNKFKYTSMVLFSLVVHTGAVSSVQSQTPKPKPVTAATPAIRTSGWTNVTNNVGGEKWGYAGVTMVSAVPGSGDIIAGVSEHGLWITSDSGSTWSQLGEAGQITHRPYHILYNKKNPKIFWVSGHYGPGLFKTMNGGRTFSRVGNVEHTDCIGVDPSDEFGRTMLLGKHESGKSLLLSSSSGFSWREIGTGLPDKSGNANHVMVLDPKTFLVGVSKYGDTVNGFYNTTDAGQSWTKLSSAASTGIPVTAADGTIYWPCAQQLMVSKDNGSTWQSLSLPGGGLICEAGPGRLINVAGKQIMISVNGGASWRAIGPPLPFDSNSVTFSEVGHTVYVSHFTDTKSPQAVMKMSIF